MQGVAGGPTLAARAEAFAAITWSKPTGKSIVYAPTDGESLKKLHLDGARTEDVTPIGSTTFLSVEYHPSGEAFAFAARRKDGESIWIAANTGKSVARLVFSTEGTKFGALGFDVDGRHLLYAAQHADNHAELHRIDMKDATVGPTQTPQLPKDLRSSGPGTARRARARGGQMLLAVARIAESDPKGS